MLDITFQLRGSVVDAHEAHNLKDRIIPGDRIQSMAG